MVKGRKSNDCLEDVYTKTESDENMSNAIGADAYDNTATYAVGDICIYNNTLYECNTVISTAEDFTPAHWTAIAILDKLRKNFVTTKINRQNITLSNTWTNYQIPLNSIQCSQGTDLTIQNNTIIIGQKTKKISVSANVMLIGSALQGSETDIHVRKNQASYIVSNCKDYQKTIEMYNISETMIDVSAGDVIDIAIMSGKTGTIEVGVSWFTVKEV